MTEKFGDAPDWSDEVELVTDGENLLVVGRDENGAAAFLRSKGLLKHARRLGARELGPMLRSMSEVTSSAAEAVAASGLWVKLTPESAEAIADYGLTETDVPGVAHAMAGTRGDIKKWLQFDMTPQARLGNPALLSGIAGALSQGARQDEAARLRALLATLDAKLDQVLRGQREEILGDLAGVERHLSASRVALDIQGEVDSQEWDKLASVPLEIRKVQSKAVLKLGSIADELDSIRRVSELNTRLPGIRHEIQLWVGTIARCFSALDDHSVLELERAAALEPGKLDVKRRAISEDRESAIADLTKHVAVLMGRMAEVNERANRNVILNSQKVPKVFASVEDSRSIVKSLYEALSLEIGWDSLTPEQWIFAIRQAQQWKSALMEGRTVAWDKGKHYVGPAIAAAAGLALKSLIKSRRP